MNTVEKRRARWQEICQEYRASGMTLGTFCKQRHTGPSEIPEGLAEDAVFRNVVGIRSNSNTILCEPLARRLFRQMFPQCCLQKT